MKWISAIIIIPGVSDPFFGVQLIRKEQIIGNENTKIEDFFVGRGRKQILGRIMLKLFDCFFKYFDIVADDWKTVIYDSFFNQFFNELFSVRMRYWNGNLNLMSVIH